MNKILIGVITVVIGLGLVGCNNDSEVKKLQEQVKKLEQQIKKSEPLLDACSICGESNTCTESKCINADKKVHCAVCDKEDSIKNMEWRKETDIPILYQHESCVKEKSEEADNQNKYKDICSRCRKDTLVDKGTNLCDDCKDYGQCYDCGEYKLIKDMIYNGRSYHCGCASKEELACEWCGEHTTDYITWKDKVNEDHHTHNGDCTDNLKAEFEKQYEIIEEAKDPTYICDICGCVGICTPYKCINPDKIPEYAGCRNCGISIMYSEDCYDGDGVPLCKDCYDTLTEKYKYGVCQQCSGPLDSSELCPNCDY